MPIFLCLCHLPYRPFIGVYRLSENNVNIFKEARNKNKFSMSLDLKILPNGVKVFCIRLPEIKQLYKLVGERLLIIEVMEINYKMNTVTRGFWYGKRAGMKITLF